MFPIASFRRVVATGTIWQMPQGVVSPRQNYIYLGVKQTAYEEVAVRVRI